ncbi:2-C-methyl-D-erythritol 4-phosphate cytidylyltransferase [Gleimia hominis]|uniref:2-C-methyl-D-erythritol 4-phosphate cytidylyltransferase n=1 Tax=Gleimia hominis TaxID=595468 RepID=A0ABU3IBX5_9ACTO|nr:2-C-methyl-D-erythritol 4-phosphate cytidylyltransferase [Gleimia hominis]MDT3766972.1 2-C-methyl-D-erythritol 4-phosphate cytidylyltransferase [Gleimia hominis]
MRDVFVIVTAAGSGTRLGFDMPKALVDLDGKTIVQHAVEGVLQVPSIAGIVVTAPSGHEFEIAGYFEPHPNIQVVTGGATRQESVFHGLQLLPEFAEKIGAPLRPNTPVLIHDAARCLTPVSVFAEVIACLRGGLPAVIPAVAVTDTQKMVASNPVIAGDGMQVDRVIGQVDRAQLRAVQTPQGFHWHTIWQAHDESKNLWKTGGATDDGALVEAKGVPVHLSHGSGQSLKITTKLDVAIARYLLQTER